MRNRSRLLLLLPLIVSAALFAGIVGAYWLLAGRAAGPAAVEMEGELRPAALRLMVSQGGISSVSAEMLAQLEPAAEWSTATLSLTLDGEPVPFLMQGSGDDARLVFYAEAGTAASQLPPVYWLEAGQGQAIQRRLAAPMGAADSAGYLSRRWEENTAFLAQAQADDNWLGPLLFAPASLELPLEGIAPNGGSGHLAVRLWSNNQAPVAPDHHLRLSLNGHLLIDHHWDGIRQETLEIAVPAGLLATSGNQLLVEAPGDTGAAGEAIYLDWISLSYASDLDASAGQLIFESDAPTIRVTGVKDPLILDVSDSRQPMLLESVQASDGAVVFDGRGDGGRYAIADQGQAWTPSMTLVPRWKPSLRVATRGADYLAIIPDELGYLEALKPLLDHRAGQGLRVAAVPLQQIYDEFSHGRPDPTAIRDFLTFTAANWQPPAPRFVLLAGDASYDPQGYLQGKNADLIPTQLVYTEYAGYVASDHWFGLLEDGQQMAVAIGRFPAQTAGQLAAMVEKTLAYEAGRGGESLGRALLVADDEPTFDVASDNLAAALDNQGYETVKLYMSSQLSIRDQILQQLNQGVGVVNYVGHGGIEVWADEVVFQAEDATLLRNGSRLPIFTTFTCLNGYFNHPQVDALAETLLSAPNGGIVAAVAPSGRTFTVQQVPLADAFYRQLLEGHSTTIGEALLAAKREGTVEANLGDVVETFNLLGDPALRFQPAEKTP